MTRKLWIEVDYDWAAAQRENMVRGEVGGYGIRYPFIEYSSPVCKAIREALDRAEPPEDWWGRINCWEDLFE